MKNNMLSRRTWQHGKAELGKTAIPPTPRRAVWLFLLVLVFAGLMLAPFELIGLALSQKAAWFMHVVLFASLTLAFLWAGFASLLSMIIVLVLLAAGLESLQLLVDYRLASLTDFLANMAGIAIGLSGSRHAIKKAGSRAGNDD